MAKKKETIFVCQHCGYESHKWIGQCTCGEWNSMVEEKIDNRGTKKIKTKVELNWINDITSSNHERLDTGIGEFNRVLGGGIVKGSLVLIAGEPGIGKSTLILQSASNIAEKYGKVLYITGEESVEQIKIRADRVDALSGQLAVLAETDIGCIEAIIEEVKPIFFVIDSIQTLYTETLSSVPGSVSQVRECANTVMRFAKTMNIPVFIIAHVTKTGELAGPRVLEHLVDTVLYFAGERNQEFRLVRAYKNRFGTTSEVGLFEMRENGLIEVTDVAATFLDEVSKNAEGAIVVSSMEGSRPLFMEVQALVTPANVGFARRTTIGIDNNRLNLILAVLEKKIGILLINQDVYVNVVGGIKPNGTSVDLGTALAVYSSYKGLSLQTKEFVVMGEISLTGEVKSIVGIEKTIKEAVRMGFKKCIVPKKNAEKIETIKDMKIYGVNNLQEAIKLLF